MGSKKHLWMATAGNMFDCAITCTIVLLGGIELNPIPRWLIHHGLIWFILAKMTIGNLANWIMYVRMPVPLMLVAWAYMAVAVWNIANFAVQFLFG